jgi:hypothetical protein
MKMMKRMRMMKRRSSRKRWRWSGRDDVIRAVIEEVDDVIIDRCNK